MVANSIQQLEILDARLLELCIDIISKVTYCDNQDAIKKFMTETAEHVAGTPNRH